MFDLCQQHGMIHEFMFMLCIKFIITDKYSFSVVARYFPTVMRKVSRCSPDREVSRFLDDCQEILLGWIILTEETVIRNIRVFQYEACGPRLHCKLFHCSMSSEVASHSYMLILIMCYCHPT